MAECWLYETYEDIDIFEDPTKYFCDMVTDKKYHIESTNVDNVKKFILEKQRDYAESKLEAICKHFEIETDHTPQELPKLISMAMINKVQTVLV